MQRYITCLKGGERMIQDLTGERYGRLLVISKTDKRRNKGVVWECKCDCGNTCERTTGELNAGRRLSCGCIRTGAMGAWHGKKRERLYITWCDMIQRCYDRNLSAFARYGGRGIKVCAEWRHNYPAFREWAKKNGYADNLTIDRIDNNGNCSPDNCRWADLKTQGRNKSNNWNITFMGKTRTLAEWAEITGLKANCIGMRLKKYGWSVERALTEKSHRVYKLKK